MFRSEELQEILTPEQRERGYSLDQDDHFVILLFEGKEVATFNATKVSAAEIRRTADRLLKEN